VSIHIADPYGTQVKTIEVEPTQGINRTVWDMTNEEDERVPPGEVVVTLEAGEEKLSQRTRIRERQH
jgi:flagellar hook assembly protein FlgD